MDIHFQEFIFLSNEPLSGVAISEVSLKSIDYYEKRNIEQGKEKNMHTTVGEMMKSNMEMVNPEATLEEAARKMKEYDCGILPVGTRNDVRGIITDRDIVIRAVSEGKNPAFEKVHQYMTAGVRCCSDNDTIKDAAKIMHKNNVGRLVVKNEDGKASGILTFGSIIRKKDDREEVSEVVACATGKETA